MNIMLINKLILYFNFLLLSEKPEIITQPTLIFAKESLEINILNYFKYNIKKGDALIFFIIDLKSEDEFNLVKNYIKSLLYYSNQNIEEVITLYNYKTKTINNETFYIDQCIKPRYAFYDNIRFNFDDPDKKKIIVLFFSENNIILNYNISYMKDLYEYTTQKIKENIAWQLKLFIKKKRNSIKLETIIFNYVDSNTNINKLEKYISENEMVNSNDKPQKYVLKDILICYIFPSLMIFLIIIFFFVYFYY